MRKCDEHLPKCKGPSSIRPAIYGEVCAMSEGEDVMQEEDMGMSVSRKIQDFMLPTQMKIGEHNPPNLPYRSWCTRVVQGRGETQSTSKSSQ